MTFSDHLKNELKAAPVFFVVFIGIGVILDMLIWQRPVNWGERIVVAVFVTALFTLWTAWRKAGADE